MSADDVDGVADAALGREAAAVDGGVRVLDPDARGRRAGLQLGACARASRCGRAWRRPPSRRSGGGRLGAGTSCILSDLPGEKRPVKLPHGSGVQLHPTSLPGGRLGPAAYEFVDWLAEAGQRVWQMLPLTRPTAHGSPYKSPSAFAAWPGLLAAPRRRGRRWRRSTRSAAEHAFWIEGWEAFAGRGAVLDQVRFDREWAALRAYAEERGVLLMGDVPIYVAPRSADQRAWPELFRDDAVAGVPPDAYSADGQLWGNPLYDWPALQRRGLPLVDRALPAHVRPLRPRARRPLPRLRRVLGGAARARRRRRPGAGGAGPGGAVFGAAARGARRAAGAGRGPRRTSRRRCARLRRELGLPGDGDPPVRLQPRRRAAGPTTRVSHEPHQVVYTGTHDNDTVVGWWATLPEERRPRSRARSPRPRRGRGHQLVDDPPRLVLAGATSRCARPRTCSASAPRRA